MNAEIRQKLKDKNEKLINMVIERARRDFPDDIAIIGLTGSFSTGDFHEKSDLDLIIINNTEQGWGISSCFILEDVGYDIYCTPWDTRIEAEANLESPMVSCLIDLQILYCGKTEYMDRLKAYQQRALEALNKPIGKECLHRAQKSIDIAKQEYTNSLLANETGAVRYAAGKALCSLVNALTSMNNTYFKRGIKRYLEEIKAFPYVPEEFKKNYEAVINAGTIEEIRRAAFVLLKSVQDLHDKMYQDLVKQPVPSYDNLRGTYEELWCNYRNKIIQSTESGNKSYAYHAALGAQDFLDEMTQSKGTKKFDIMKYFKADHLMLFRDEFMEVMDEYLEEYKRVGRNVEHYDTFQQLYDCYMSR